MLGFYHWLKMQVFPPRNKGVGKIRHKMNKERVVADGPVWSCRCFLAELL